MPGCLDRGSGSHRGLLPPASMAPAAGLNQFCELSSGQRPITAALTAPGGDVGSVMTPPLESRNLQASEQLGIEAADDQPNELPSTRPLNEVQVVARQPPPARPPTPDPPPPAPQAQAPSRTSRPAPAAD